MQIHLLLVCTHFLQELFWDHQELYRLLSLGLLTPVLLVLYLESRKMETKLFRFEDQLSSLKIMKYQLLQIPTQWEEPLEVIDQVEIDSLDSHLCGMESLHLLFFASTLLMDQNLEIASTRSILEICKRIFRSEQLIPMRSEAHALVDSKLSSWRVSSELSMSLLL